MGHTKDGPAAGDGQVQGDSSRWDTKDLRSNNRVANPRQDAIRGELTGSTVCIAAGLKVDANSPILAMCRRLIEAGFNPALQLYRGTVLCLIVRAIAEGAQLEVNSSGIGFIARRRLRPGSPVRSNGPGGHRMAQPHRIVAPWRRCRRECIVSSIDHAGAS